MARSTSTYGKTFAPVHTVKLAAFGLCPTHKTAILSDLTCWECGPDSAPLAAPAPAPSTGRQLADEVRSAIAAARPEIAEAIRSALNTARSQGQLDEATLRSALEVLTTIAGNDTPAAPAPAPKPAPAARPNKFAAKCADCGGWVEAEAGSCAKVDGRWIVRHVAPCPPKAETPAPVASTVPDGYYALPSSGDNDLVFYRVTSSEKWGRSVQMIVGGHADTYVARKAVAGILARIEAATYTRPGTTEFDGGEYVGPDAAGLRYADEIGTCCRCNRTLTDATSRANGIGPVCILAD